MKSKLPGRGRPKPVEQQTPALPSRSPERFHRRNFHQETGDGFIVSAVIDCGWKAGMPITTTPRGGPSPQRSQSYDDNNRGVLFWQAEKEADNHPDWTGNINIDGRRFEIAGWCRKAEKTGQDYISIKVSKELF
ncbi:MAG: hypothetical protein KIS67_22220 [Verrucomicrobiae bacterium]|nr:hypothetical protein [Verrucomicrobiae bacterium]